MVSKWLKFGLVSMILLSGCSAKDTVPQTQAPDSNEMSTAGGMPGTYEETGYSEAETNIIAPMSSEIDLESMVYESGTDAEETIPETQAALIKHFLIGTTTSSSVANINLATVTGGNSKVFDVTDPNWWYGYEVQTWDKEALTAVIGQLETPADAVYLNGVQITSEDWERLDMLRAMNGIPAQPEVMYGVVSRNTDVRLYPTAERLTVGATTVYIPANPETFDRFQVSVLTAGEAVIICHTSTDGLYYFVQATNTSGWIKKADVVGCSYDTMYNWENAMDFVVVTDRQLHTSTMEEQLDLQMGTRLLYYEETDSCFYALLPCDAQSNPNYVLTSRYGTFDLIDGKNYQEGDLPVKRILVEKESSNAGYLILNDITILEQAEKLLGMMYGWGGERGGTDCSGMLNMLYRCFGIILPRDTKDMAQVCGGNANIVKDVSKMTEEEKEVVITAGEAGTVLLMQGHVLLYAGEVDEVPMVIHSVTSYQLENGTTSINTGSCVRTPLSIRSTAGDSYLDLINYVISFY